MQGCARRLLSSPDTPASAVPIAEERSEEIGCLAFGEPCLLRHLPHVPQRGLLCRSGLLALRRLHLHEVGDPEVSRLVCGWPKGGDAL